MKRRQAIGILGLVTAAKAASTRDRFVGVWKLLTVERKTKSGDITYPFGQQPLGRITYDKKGRMSAQVIRKGRRSASLTASQNSLDSIRTATADDLRDMVTGFACYFGTYDVDEGAQMVIHHVEGAFLPTWIGTDLKRNYQFAGNRLTLSVASANAVTSLVWERESD